MQWQASSATRCCTRWTHVEQINARGPPGAQFYRPDPLRALLAISRELRPKPRALYRGLFCVPFFAPAAYGLYFSAYEVASRKTESELAAGLCAEACANPCYIPYDVVKQRYMVGRARGTVVAATRLILRRDGLRGLYRGFLLTFATYGPFSAIYFWSYDLFTRHMGQYRSNGTLAAPWPACDARDWLKTRVQILRTLAASSRIALASVRTRGLGAVRARRRRVLARGFLWDHDACGCGVGLGQVMFCLYLWPGVTLLPPVRLPCIDYGRQGCL